MDRKKTLIWIGVAALVVAMAALVAIPKSGGGPLPASGDVTNPELRDLAAGGARLIDVRTAGEFAAGHIEGAENVPVDSVGEASASWDKQAPLVVYCETGARSLNASQYLLAQGFAHVYDLTEGFVAWDGGVVAGEAPAPGAVPATGRPTLYEFTSDS